jgi:transcriptional regulator with XRE-family HTH domain
MGNDFGETLRYLRERAGLSLADLAHRTHCAKALIGHVETGYRRPTLDLAQACDRALGTQPLLELLIQRTGGDDVRRRALLGSMSYLAAGAVAGVDGLAEVVRQGLLAEIGHSGEWDAIVATYARQLVTAPSEQYGPAVLADLNLLLQYIRDGSADHDEFRAAAGLGNMFGLWLGNRSELMMAHRWYRTAAVFADHSGDTHLATYIRGRTAARATYEGATVRQTEDAIAQIMAATGGAPSIGTLEAWSAEAHLGALTVNASRGRAAVRAMRDVAAALPEDADPWGAASPAARATFVTAYVECRVGTVESAQPIIDQALAELDDWPMWQAEVHQYRARTMVAGGDVAAGLTYALDAVRRIPHAARVVGVAVRDVVDQVPAGYRSEVLEELRAYASPEPGPWETIR